MTPDTLLTLWNLTVEILVPLGLVPLVGRLGGYVVGKVLGVR